MEKQNFKKLAEIARKEIQDKKLSMYSVAQKTGLTYPTVSRFFKGEKSVKIESQQKILIHMFGKEKAFKLISDSYE